MKKVNITVTYFSNTGKCVTSTYTTSAVDVVSLFHNAVVDANLFAHLHKGSVTISQSIDKLHIQYFGVNVPVIERMFIVAGQQERFIFIDEQQTPQYV